MRLIEADKVKQAMKDYWKAQVDKALTLTDGNEKRINIYLEHNHELLKAIDELPSIQPFHNITMTDVLRYIDGMPEDVWLEFTECLKCRGWELQWCGGDFA